ncbi:hypothetical protein PO902_09785 [Planococcus maritimus]|nr:hypothetical protein [Planococcus sp. SK3692]MDE4085312.1 hypothetical protein [Planococcus maritimus]
MKNVILLLKIILAISALCSISLGIYMYLHANDGAPGHLLPLALTTNSFITIILLLLFTLEKRMSQSKRLDSTHRK